MEGSQGTAGSPPAAENRVAEHLGRILDLYKHHYDLFVKGYIFYLSIVGAITTLLFRFVPDKPTKLLLAGMGMAVSLMSVASCYFGYKWSEVVGEQLDGMTASLRLPNIPLENSRKLIQVLLVLSAAMCVAFAFSGLLAATAKPAPCL